MAVMKIFPDSIKEPYVRSVRILNFLSFILIVVVNVLATAGLNGKKTGEISDIYYTYVTPAGYAFSIWGLIYFLLAVFSVYQLFPQTYAFDEINKGVNLYFILNSLFNVAWIFCWHWELLYLSLFVMSGILITLWIIFNNFAAHHSSVFNFKSWFLIRSGFGIYLGWIIVATVVNVFCASTNRDEKYVDAGVVGLLIAFFAEGFLSLIYQDSSFAGVGSWATFAIYTSQKSFERISTTALVVGILLAVEAVVILLNNLCHRKKEGKICLV